MNRLTENTLILGLISIFAVACGDTGDAYVDDPGLDEADAGQIEDPANQDDPVDEEPPVDEPPVDDEPPVNEEPQPEPFCGDGFIDDGEQCDDGNDEAGDGCSANCEVEELVLETEGTVRIELTLDDLSSNTEPLETSCVDSVDVMKDGNALFIDGQCFLPANVIQIAGSGEVDEDGVVQGDMTFTLNGRDNEVPFEGSLDANTLELEFFGVTIVGGPVRGIWDGTVDANFE